MDQPTQKHPIIAYFEAKGFMRRRPFATLAVSWFFFTIMTAIFVFQNLSEAGVDVTQLKEAPQLPIWAVLAILTATVALIPAVIMRARDAGWPQLGFIALMAVHIFIKLINAFTGGALPEIIGDLVELAVYIMLLVLMFKPSNG